MSVWLFQLDFQQGSGWEDVSSNVDYDSWKGKTSTLWNDLKPVSDYCTFHIRPDVTLALKFYNYNDPIKVYIKKDGSDYFVGYVRKDAKIQITSGLDRIAVECIDRFYILQKKIFTSFLWKDYKICDPAGTSTSIVHQLLVLAGLTTGDVANVTISKVIDYFIVEENMKTIPDDSKGQIQAEEYLKRIDKSVSVGMGGDTYLNILRNLLFQFGYTFYFDASGKFTPYDFLPTDVSNSNYFRHTEATKNILIPLVIKKNKADFEGTDIRWFSVKELPDYGLEKPILYQDINTPAATFKCAIELDPGEHYPGGAGTDAVYVDFEIDGIDIVACTNVELKLSYTGTITTNTFTFSGRRAKIDLENTGGSAAIIQQFDIIGKAIIKDQDHIAKCRLESGTEKVIEYSTEYIRDSDDAAKLVSGMARHYIYGNKHFSLVSSEEFDIGDFVTIDDDLILNIEQICIVLQKRFNEITGEHEYQCESIANYSLETVSTDRIHRMPKAMLTNALGFADTFLLLSSAGNVILYYDGADPASPAEGDKQWIITTSGIKAQERTGGSWSDMTGLQLFAAATALSFMVGCGLTNPNTETPGTEPFPGKNHRVFMFENNYEDQHGINDWDTKQDVVCSTVQKKFGSYSLFATSGNNGHLQTKTDYANIGESQSMGAWVYVTNRTGTPGYWGPIALIAAVDNLKASIYEDGSGIKICGIINKNGTVTYLYSDYVTVDTWHYIAFSYNSTLNEFYLVIDNVMLSTTPPGTWGSGTWYIQVSTKNGTQMKVYTDEACFAPDQYIHPDIWVQHYNHGIPWETEYSQQDTTLLAGPLGQCYLGGSAKIKNQLTIAGAARCRVTKNDSQAISDATWTVVEYDDEDFDNLSEYDNSSNFRFTAIEAGYYLVSAVLQYSSSAWTMSNTIDLALYKNGTKYSILHHFRFWGITTTRTSLQGTDIVYLAVGDYIDIRTYHNGGARKTTNNVATENYFAVHRIS